VADLRDVGPDSKLYGWPENVHDAGAGRAAVGVRYGAPS
jgi:hypothetical protein